MGNFNFDILDVLTLLNIPFSANTGRISFDINCPFCANDTQKHMNINVQKNVFRCNRCGAHGGMLDLYGLCQNIHEYKECFKEVTERLNGSPFYENCKQKRVIVNEPLEEPYKPVDIEKRNAVYSLLLSCLRLTDAHRQNLRMRGFDDEQIDKNGYKSVPVIGYERIAKRISDAGLSLNGIPGFFLKEIQGVKTWTLLDFPSGIMIPVRNIDGKIEGLQIRLDNTPKRKFRWLSTNEMDSGSRAYSWCHVVGSIQETMYLTEGPLKADIAHFLSKKSFISVPGVNCSEQFIETLKILNAKGTTRIVCAFDMDKRTNDAVLKAQENMKQLITGMGMKFCIVEWCSSYKGIDDFLLYQKLKKCV